MSESAAGRIVDANFNRAREGLRVIEETARFAWDDAVLAAEAKRIRHGLLAALGPAAVAANILCRDTAGDVGTAISTPAEARRPDAAAILAAAFKRTSEALRVIEEYSKLQAPAAGAGATGFSGTAGSDTVFRSGKTVSDPFSWAVPENPVPPAGAGSGFAAVQRLRYDLYVLESAFARRLRPGAGGRMAGVRLYVIVTESLCRRPLAETVDAALAGGADCVQLREKGRPDGEVLSLAKEIAGRCHAAGRLFIMNDRADVAALSGADGVHVGQEDLPVGAARRIVGPAAVVGVSCQTIEHARAAVLAGADYLGVGPLFVSTTKAREHVPGAALMRQVAAEVRIPAVAIAGISRATLDAALAAGARRVAVCSAIVGAADVEAETRWFAGRLAEAAGAGGTPGAACPDVPKAHT